MVRKKFSTKLRRIKRYVLNVIAEKTGIIVDRQLAYMGKWLEVWLEYADRHEKEIIHILNKYNVVEEERKWYIWYSKHILALCVNYTAKTLEKKIDIAKNEFKTRGLNYDILSEIADKTRTWEKENPLPIIEYHYFKEVAKIKEIIALETIMKDVLKIEELISLIQIVYIQIVSIDEIFQYEQEVKQEIANITDMVEFIQ